MVLAGEVNDQPQGQEICDHFYIWISPAGTNKSARICGLCHDPDPEWLNTIVEVPDSKENMTVPIKFDGLVVGKAEISPDGKIINAELYGSGVGQELRNVLLCGLADSVSIKPNFVPSVKER